MQGWHNGKRADLLNWPIIRLTKLVFFGARAMLWKWGTHVYPHMSKGCLQPLVIFGVIFVYANLCMHILALIFQDGGNPFPVTRLLVLNSMTDLPWPTLLLPLLHSQGSGQVYIIHRRITAFLVVQEATCTHMRMSIGCLEPLVVCDLQCNFNTYISISRFLEPISISIGGSRNRDSTLWAA